MFLERYLEPVYLDLVYSNYDEYFLSLLDEENFNKIYQFLKNDGFYFIDDIILNYLELFEIEEKYVVKVIVEIKSTLGENYIEEIGKDMTNIDKIIDLAVDYCEKDNAGF